MAVQAQIKWKDTVIASLDAVEVGSAAEFRGNINENTTQIAEAFNSVSKEYATEMDKQFAEYATEMDKQFADGVNQVRNEGAQQINNIQTAASAKMNLSFVGTEAERVAFEATQGEGIKTYLWFDTSAT